MDVLEQLEEVLTLDQAQDLADSSVFRVTEEPQSTQQMLDNLLGYFDDDDPAMVLSLSAEPYPGLDE